MVTLAMGNTTGPTTDPNPGAVTSTAYPFSTAAVSRSTAAGTNTTTQDTPPRVLTTPTAESTPNATPASPTTSSAAEMTRANPAISQPGGTAQTATLTTATEAVPTPADMTPMATLTSAGETRPADPTTATHRETTAGRETLTTASVVAMPNTTTTQGAIPTATETSPSLRVSTRAVETTAPTSVTASTKETASRVGSSTETTLAANSPPGVSRAATSESTAPGPHTAAAERGTSTGTVTETLTTGRTANATAAVSTTARREVPRTVRSTAVPAGSTTVKFPATASPTVAAPSSKVPPGTTPATQNFSAAPSVTTEEQTTALPTCHPPAANATSAHIFLSVGLTTHLNLSEPQVRHLVLSKRSSESFANRAGFITKLLLRIAYAFVSSPPACADPGPTSAVPAPPEDEFTPGAGSPPTAERGLLRAASLAALETAVTSAAQAPLSLSDMAANAGVTTLPGESAISSGHASEAGASFPAEVATASLVSAVNGDNVNSAPETVSSPPEPGASGGEAAEIPTEEAGTSASTTNPLHASPENGTVATTPAGEAAATLALFYSSPTDPQPTLFSPAELEVTRSVPGALPGVTTSSSLSAAAENGRATPSTGGGPEDLASTGTAVSSGRPLSPSLGETESTRAAFQSPAAPAAKAFVSETESPGHDGASAPASPDPPSESETGRGTSAPAGKPPPPASVAGGEEVGSLGPAETEREGLPRRAFSSITGSTHPASESETVTAPAAPEGRGDTGKSVSATNEETPISVIDTQSQPNPSPSDAEQSPANTEELPTGDPGALSNARTSPRSFLEPGTVTAIPTPSGETAPSAVPSPSDIPTEPSVSESESTGSSWPGFSGAPRSPQPPPDAAVGTAPVAAGAGEELANSAQASVKGTPLAPSVLESVSPAAAAKGPAGVNVSGGFASGVAAPSSAELAANRSANEAAITSHVGTWSETDPSPWGAEPNPAPMGELPTGEPGALAMDSPQPSLARETALAPAPSEKGEDMASPVSVVHGETPISNPHLQSGTNPSPSVPELSPGDAAELPAGETAAMANAEASPRAPLGDGTMPGRLTPSGGTSPPAFASPSGALAEPETTGDATKGLSGALGAPCPAPTRETLAASEGTSAPVFVVLGDPASLPSISHSPGGPSAMGSAPLSSAGEREGRGDAAAANEETTTSNPDGQPAEASPASRAELPPGEGGVSANAETSPYSPSGDGGATGIHAPSGETSPAAFASPGETAAGPSAPEAARPDPLFSSAPVPVPAAPEGPTVTGPAGITKEAAVSASGSGVPAALPGLEAPTGQSLTTLRLATSRAPSATGSDSPSLHAEKGKMPPERGANLGSAGAPPGPAAPPATTPALARGRAETPFPPLGTTVTAVPLYPYGAKETDKQFVERRMDFKSPVFKPEIGFPLGKTLRDSLYFTDNGQIIFPASDSDMFPSPNPPPGGFTGHEKVPMVAVFWANADFSEGVGTTFYQEFVTLDSAEHPFVRDVEAKIRRYLKTSYSAKWTLKITWEKAPAFPARQPVTRTNTYQAVLTTDGIKSYVLILYQDGGMQWDYTKMGLTNVLMGYSSGDGFYRNDDLTRRPPAAKYRPDQVRGYNTGLADARVTMLYPASPNQYGAGVRCLYNSQNELVDGRQERSWKDSRQVSPDRDAELKLHDWCCRQAGSPQLCAKYSQKRPKISCAGYRLPNQTRSSEEAESYSEEGRGEHTGRGWALRSFLHPGPRARELSY
ncbi:Mucin-4 [Chelonia mydas]|uniref:Mucin-4 n=1 Tax=Chelonia mydas TaxID=8469 RepID=M7CAF8_CHEMY|nr:Mucin-4 [Chelonia mydas]